MILTIKIVFFIFLSIGTLNVIWYLLYLNTSDTKTPHKKEQRKMTTEEALTVLSDRYH